MSLHEIRKFAYFDLPLHLQTICAPVGQVAEMFQHLLVDCPDKRDGMRFLLQARGAFVRAALKMDKAELLPAPPEAAPVDYDQLLRDDQAVQELRLRELDAYFATEDFRTLDKLDQELLAKQYGAMLQMNDILLARVRRLGAKEATTL